MITERMFVIAVGFALDLILGDPHFLYHPVQAMGAVIKGTVKRLQRILRLSPEREEDIRRKQIAGGILVAVVLALSVGVPAAALLLAGRVHPVCRVILECIMCYQVLAMKSLRVESMKVYKALRTGDLEASRHAVSMIVGRDTDRLTAEGVTKAAVETVAENTSDGEIAPLLFLFVLGPLGGFFYKAVNTMDSMVGYKNDTYRYLGTCAAKLDDWINFLPARLAAVAMIAVSFPLGMDGRNALRIFRRDRLRHSSPNSAQTESVCAGALCIQLAGDAWYFGQLYHKPTIGDPIRPVETEDIRRANRLLYAASFLVFAAGMLILFALSSLTL